MLPLALMQLRTTTLPFTLADAKSELIRKLRCGTSPVATKTIPSERRTFCVTVIVALFGVVLHAHTVTLSGLPGWTLYIALTDIALVPISPRTERRQEMPGTRALELLFAAGEVR